MPRMVRHRDERPLVRTVVSGRALTLLALVCGISGAILPAPAWAGESVIGPGVRTNVSNGGGHGGDFPAVTVNAGNGILNRTYSTLLSPTVNRGMQQVANTNVSGNTHTQFGFCWRTQRMCRISQALHLGRVSPPGTTSVTRS